MTMTKKRPKAKQELNFFMQGVEVSSINEGQEFVLVVPLIRASDYNGTAKTFVQVSKEKFSSIITAYRAIETGEYSLPEELKSYLLSKEVYDNEGTAYYETDNKVLQTTADSHDRKVHMIGYQMYEHRDDAPDIYFAHKVVSREQWDTEEEAQQAFDSGDWIKVTEWNLTPYYLEIGALKIEYNELRKGFVYCREILYRNDRDDSKDPEFMVDYLECSPQAYLTPEQAQKALEDYLASI